MYYDTCNTSVLTINGTETCRIVHPDKDFRTEVISQAVVKLAPSSIYDVNEKFWGLIRSLVERGMKIDAIKLIRILDDSLGLGEAKELAEFIASVEINH